MKVKRSTVTHREPTPARWGFPQGRRLITVGLFGLAIIGLSLSLGKAQAASLRNARSMKLWSSRYARLPLSFEPNHGQTNSRVKYLARGRNYTLFLTGHDAVLALRSGTLGRKGQKPVPSAVIRLRLLGSASAVRVTGQSRLPGTSNYFLGSDPHDWHTQIPNYSRVRYHQVYPGIDLVYYGRQGELENDFVLSPGSAPDSIRVGVEGVNGLSLAPSGDLVLKVGDGKVYLRRPRAYQGNREVAVHYVLEAKNEIRFKLGRYDRRQKLVIDPVLAYSTYLGGNGGDIGYGIAVDSSGNVYVTGITNSSNFPTTTGTHSTTSSGGADAFVVKINPSGAATGSTNPQLVYSTYLGGSGTDSGNAIAVDAGGDAYITGSTDSTDFATTTGVFQSTSGGGGDAFVAELNSTGSTLVYSSYLGGSGADAGMGIAWDSLSKNAFVTGSTQSPNFPTVNPAQPTNHGSSDAFITEVNFDGTALVYSTYVGGSNADVGESIKVDSSGNAYIAGYTFSSDPSFPLTNPVQGSNAGTVNAFVTEAKPDGSPFLFSTYFGGSNDDRAFGLALGPSGSVYIAGSSQSTDFPTTTGVVQGTNQGQSDAFVAKLNPAGPSVTYATLLGGAGVDQANGIAVDSSGNAYITGFTNSSSFPLASPIQTLLGITGGSACGTSTCTDAFVTELNPTATALVQSTYLGGSGADFGQAIALGNGNAFVTGSTSSTNFPAIDGAYPAYQSNLTGVAGNAFISEIKPDNLPGLSIVPQTLDFGNQTQNVRSAVQSIQVTNEGTAPLTITQITFTETDTTGATADFAETDNCVGTVAASGGNCTINVTFTPSYHQVETGTFSITDNAAGSPHVIKVSGTGVTTATAVTVTPSSLTFGNVTVGNTSSAQTVTITNTGTQTLTFTTFQTTGDYSQTNTCTSNTLNVGQSCTVSVTFSPTASGARNGSLAINDNAAGSPQVVALSGTGVSQFTLSSSSPNVTTVIGNGSATFSISATAPNSFTGNITLSCPSTLTASGGTCTFNPAAILPGQTSTLTIANLTDSLPIDTVKNKYGDTFAFDVTGTSGSQSTTVSLNLLFADYALSTSPSFNTIVAGSPATYSISLTPINGFNKQVQLACGNGMPPGATCSFSKSSVTPSGTTTVTLTIQTTKNSSAPPPPAIPPGMVPPLMVAFLVLILAGLFVLGRKRSRVPGLAGRRWVVVQVCTLCLLLLGETFLVSCRSTPTATGSTTGNYTITINGTLGSNSSVVRSTNINLAIT